MTLHPGLPGSVRLPRNPARPAPVTPAPVLVAGTPRRGGDLAPVAVCIPVLQGERHLAATLRSVLAQTLRDVEVVVLDNASTDGTAELLAGFDDPRLVVWRNPVTVPMGENFRRAVALSGAPYVKILPADDVLEPDCLASQALALAHDPGLAVVVGRQHLVDERGVLLARSRFLRGLVGRHGRAEVLRRVVRHGANPIGVDAAALFRRDAYEAAGGYGDDVAVADLDLWLRLLRHGDFLGLPEAVTRFRVGGHAASAADHRADHAAQRAFTASAATDTSLRRLDVLVGRCRAPLARRRRELIYTVARLTELLGGPR